MLESMKKLQDMYKPENVRLQALVIGEKGCGKTHILQTARRPVYHYCLDPGGEVTLLDENGQVPSWLIPDTRFQGNTGADYDAFKLDLITRLKNGDFNDVGTLCLDSLTTLSDSCLAKISGKPGQSDTAMHQQKLDFAEWGMFLTEMQFVIKKMLTAPCDLIITGHIMKNINSVTGSVINTIMIPGQTAQKCPTWFSEVWYMVAEDIKKSESSKGKKPEDLTGEDVHRYLVTQNTGKYQAGTRIGRNGRFNLHEKPDIQYLMEKAGLMR